MDTLSTLDIALAAASRARLQRLEETGNPRAAQVNQLLATRERVTGALLIAKNLANIAATVLVTGLFVALFGGVGLLYAVFAATALVVMFSAILPKTIALAAPERGALLMVPLVAGLVAVLGPVTGALQGFARRLLDLFGRRPDAEAAAVSGADEIRGAVALLAKEGSVAKEDRAMLGGLLDLKELVVSDIMIHRTKMEVIDADLPMPAIIEAALESQYTRIPVFKDQPENVVGVLHAKELIRALQAAHGDAAKLALADLMAAPWFTPDTTPLADQLKAFLKRKAHIALVVDEYGEVMGLVTLEDIIEEIVGDISDETDLDIPSLRVAPDGWVGVDGQVPIRDLNRALDWALPDEEATTIAGLVIHEARVIPEAGQAFTFYGFTFQVVRKERNRITRLRIRPTQEALRARAPAALSPAAPPARTR